MIAVTMPGAARGRMIRTMAETRPQPSIMAASSSSLEIEAKVPLSIHAANA